MEPEAITSQVFFPGHPSWIFCIGMPITSDDRRRSVCGVCTGFDVRTSAWIFISPPDITRCIHLRRFRALHPHPSPFQGVIALLFVPTGTFLALILDSKVSREPPLRCLRSKCERSLNVLKVSSFFWPVVADSAPTLSFMNPLTDGLWQLRAWVRHEVQ